MFLQVRYKKKLSRVNKNEKEIIKNISYTLQFTDSARFMASSLWNLVSNFSEGVCRTKCKFIHDYKKCETWRIKYCKDVTWKQVWQKS